MRPTLVSAESELSNGRDDLGYYSKSLNIQKLNYQIDEIVWFDTICKGQKIVDISLGAEEGKYLIQNIRNQVGATKKLLLFSAFPQAVAGAF